MTFIRKLKTVLEHYKIPYSENKYQFFFRLGKDTTYDISKQTNGYRVIRHKGNQMYYDSWFFNSKQFNDFADIFLEDIPNEY